MPANDDRRDGPAGSGKRGVATDSRNRKGWGSVARRGAAMLNAPPSPTNEPEVDLYQRGPRPDADWAPEKWERTDKGASTSSRSAAPARRSRKRQMDLPPEIDKDLAFLGDRRRIKHFKDSLAKAMEAYDEERYSDAAKTLRALVKEAPRSATTRELYGLALYQLDNWADAVEELEAFRTLTNAVTQNPVIADCYRGLKDFRKIDELWEDLAAVSPSAELVVEGRIVTAGAYADQGDIAKAIRFLERASKPVKQPRWHHLRLWYVLADLYERAGEIPRAREAFSRIQQVDPEFFDVSRRIESLD